MAVQRVRLDVERDERVDQIHGFRDVFRLIKELADHITNEY